MLAYAFPNRYNLVVVDLTFGTGRFYRIARKRIANLIGVDIEKHEWEIKPDVFYQMPCQLFVHKVLKGLIELPQHIDLVVVDPPWSQEKRGVFPVSHMPRAALYHIKNINTKAIIMVAEKLAAYLDAKLLYRYKECLTCNHIIKVDANVTIMKNKGVIHYGICSFKR
jgi:predicted RNA methylase